VVAMLGSSFGGSNLIALRLMFSVKWDWMASELIVVFWDDTLVMWLASEDKELSIVSIAGFVEMANEVI
jgi:hypothetical protein